MQTPLELQTLKQLYGINEIIHCVCHYALTLRFPMKDNFPVESSGTLQTKHAKPMKETQKVHQTHATNAKQKAHIISLVGRFDFIVNPIFHPFTMKQHNR
jgi:hypothetical protein